MNSKFTLITGASTGLGKQLATECARLGRNLILTALPGEQIKELKTQLSDKYGIFAYTYEADLTENSAVEKLATSILSNFEIDMLINNAGIGGTKPFLEASPYYIDQIVLLNMRATVLLTRLLLPGLKKHKKSHILNIASMASFGPMPYKTVYPASKAFVYSFSRGLSAELKGSGVIVSVAHPGAMKTNVEVISRIEKHSKIIQATTLSAEKVAQICIRKLLNDDKLIIPGFLNKVSWLVLKIIPVWLRLTLMRSSLQNEIRESKPIVQLI